MLTFGSCAMGIHEPCQVRNGAALSESSHVPQGRLNRANCQESVCGWSYEAIRADNILFIEAVALRIFIC